MKDDNLNKENKLIGNENKEKEASLKEKISLKFRKALISNRLRTLILIACLIIIFIALNLWIQSKDLKQIDVTASKLYSLTQTSKDELSKLNKDVNIYIYGYAEDSVYVDLIKQYSAYSDKIKYEIVTIENNYKIVEKYRLSDYSYGSMVVVCGNKDTTLFPDYQFASYDYSSGEQVDISEETITNAILNVSTDDPVKIYFTTGQGEFTLNEISTLVTTLKNKIYECEELNLLSVSTIPEDCDVLAILNPKSDLNEAEANVIKDYINRGGNIFFTRTNISKEPFTNLQSVLDLYGVSVDYGVLYEGNYNNYASYESKSYPIIVMPNFSSYDDITSKLSESGYRMLMPFAQKLTIKEVEEENVEVTSSELLNTSNKCYSITDIENTLNVDNIEPDSYTIASSFTRKMKKEEKDIESKLIVVGNASFLADFDYNLGLVETPIAQGANYDFTLNCLADLANQDNLITVRKASNVTTFTSTSMQDLIVKTIIFGVPILIILVGIVIWTIRRRKR